MKRQVGILIENYIDKKIAPLLESPVEKTNPQILHIMALKAMVGIKEEGGNNSGALVRSIQETIGKAEKEPWCFPGDVEIMTENGWTRFDELEKGEKVFQVSDKCTLSTVAPNAIIKKEYNDIGFRLRSNSIDIFCDKNHRFYGEWSGSKEREFRPLTEMGSILKVPSVESENNDATISDKELQFLAAFLSDGFFSKTRQGRPRIRIQVSKERKLADLEKFERLGKHTASRVYGKTKTPLTTFLFDVPQYFCEIFDDYKSLKWDFVHSLSKNQCRIFLESYVNYDGCIIDGGNMVFTSSIEQRDRLMTIVLMAGYHPYSSDQFSPLSGRPNYTIRWSESKKYRHFTKENIEGVEINQTLYCVSVPHEKIVVRGPGSCPMIVGNCMSSQQCAIAYVEKKTKTKCSVPVSEHCLTVFREAGKLNIVVKDPLVGDLMIYQKGDTDKGHVAAIIEDGDEFVRTAEGNTGPDRGVTRDGDGFYNKLRSLKGYGDMKVVGFVRVEFKALSD